MKKVCYFVQKIALILIHENFQADDLGKPGLVSIRQNMNKVNFTIETTGALPPEEVVHQGLEILKTKLDVLKVLQKIHDSFIQLKYIYRANLTYFESWQPHVPHHFLEILCSFYHTLPHQESSKRKVRRGRKKISLHILEESGNIVPTRWTCFLLFLFLRHGVTQPDFE